MGRPPGPAAAAAPGGAGAGGCGLVAGARVSVGDATAARALVGGPTRAQAPGAAAARLTSETRRPTWRDAAVVGHGRPECPSPTPGKVEGPTPGSGLQQGVSLARRVPTSGSTHVAGSGQPSTVAVAFETSLTLYFVAGWVCHPATVGVTVTVARTPPQVALIVTTIWWFTQAAGTLISIPSRLCEPPTGSADRTTSDASGHGWVGPE